ncbi:MULTISPECIES: lipid II flippase MurJ [unclassified Pyramidobacter]|uniref:lipid II flippase MurJ n=1 Tax=unclassified Pyramidobacter TaxID=2632171 RepID=UPI000EA2715E|nr:MULTISPECIES: lipid II flippase MurJ [unclassified Pyramidobacter]RKJ75378.1 hypothetical protein D7D26_11750 [Pyramidobacter sp. CG50-2]WOL40672.1 lipid II flippase MurJ [Pyramidobacter sp. YE332]
MAVRHKIRDFFCGAQEARAGALVSVTVGALSKPVGYLRTLMLAWLFGASAGMDAFYVSMGILSLLCQIVQNVTESALLPRLVRQQTEADAAALMARVFRLALIGALLLAALTAAFSSPLAAFFARRFDPPRLKTAARMLVILIPWGGAWTLMPFFEVWNNFKGRYSLSVSLSALGHALLIPAIWAASFFWGVYAVPAMYSLVVALLAWGTFRATGDFPWRAAGAARKEALRELRADCLLCVGIVGASGLYQLVDRYFASGLPAGNISALSYAGLIYTLPQSVLAPALMIYLHRVSALMACPETPQAQLKAVMCTGWLYMFPPAALMSALSRPLVRIFLGYGAFDAAAVALTAPCMAAAAWSLPLMLWGQFLSRYAQAAGRLKTILSVSYGALALNAFLDWMLAPRWGAPGLCVATGLTWGGSALVYAALLAPGALKHAARAVWKPSLAFALSCVALWPLRENGIAAVLAGGLLAAAYYLGGERLGFFDSVPPVWRPRALLALALRRKRGE